MTREAADWNELKERLQRSAAAVEQSLAPVAEQMEDILRARAERLARRPEPPREGGADATVLVFALGAERYAIELDRVSELIARPGVAPLPGAPREVAGAIQVRGEIRVVWELTELLGLPGLEQGGPEYVIMVRLRGSREYGLRVGALESIRKLTASECGAPADAGAVRWITPDMLAVLDCDNLWKEEYR